MQFRLSDTTPDATVIAAALRLLDPDVKVTRDDAQGCVDVRSSASEEDVTHALQRLGFDAEPLQKDVHVSGGSTCCGGCG